MRRTFLLCLLLVSVICRAQSPWPRISGPKIQFDLPSQPLDDALTAVGTLADIEISVDPRTHAHEMTSVALKGSLTADEALHQLLAPTNLQLKPIHGRLLATVPDPVRKSPSIDAADEAATTRKLELIVVTGTHSLNHASDVSSVNTFTVGDLPFNGTTQLSQFLDRLPQNFSRLNPATSTAASIDPVTGTNIMRGYVVDLHGFGDGGTLALLDGFRLPPSGVYGSYTDVSLLPLNAFTRVDVLTDGASAIYGSDAVAGVINFVLRRDFEGLEIKPYYSAVNGNGGSEHGASLLWGNKWDGGDLVVNMANNDQQAVNASSPDPLQPQTGPFAIVPAQELNSGVFAMDQQLASGLKLAADGLWSRRTFNQRYRSEAPGATDSNGRAELLSGNFSSSMELPGNWHTTATSSYSRETENVTNSAATTVQSFRTRSSITSVDLGAGRPVLSMTAGDIDVSIGLTWRHETFANLQTGTGMGLARDIWGGTAEVWVPIVSDNNALSWAKRIALSLAVRHDDYRHGEVGGTPVASNNPKVTLLWNPWTVLTLRGTFARSFRAPPLAQTQASTDSVFLLSLPNPSAPGSKGTAYITGGNSALQPEIAQSFGAGADVALDDALKLSITYFHVDYRDRIAPPPVLGPVRSIYGQLQVLRPYFNLSPSPADIQALYDHPVYDLDSVGQAGIGAIFDGTQKNIEATEASGVDLIARATLPTNLGKFRLIWQSEYLAKLDNQAAPGSPYISAVNTVFNPPRWREQAGASWSLGRLSISTNTNFTGSYKDTLTPGDPHISSWFTVDCGVAYSIEDRLGTTLLDHTTFEVYLRNATDRVPPRVASLADETFAYDLSHASALRRSVVLTVTKQW